MRQSPPSAREDTKHCLNEHAKVTDATARRPPRGVAAQPLESTLDRQVARGPSKASRTQLEQRRTCSNQSTRMHRNGGKVGRPRLLSTPAQHPRRHPSAAGGRVPIGLPALWAAGGPTTLWTHPSGPSTHFWPFSRASCEGVETEIRFRGGTLWWVLIRLLAHMSTFALHTPPSNAPTPRTQTLAAAPPLRLPWHRVSRAARPPASR